MCKCFWVTTIFRPLPSVFKKKKKGKKLLYFNCTGLWIYDAFALYIWRIKLILCLFALVSVIENHMGRFLQRLEQIRIKVNQRFIVCKLSHFNDSLLFHIRCAAVWFSLFYRSFCSSQQHLCKPFKYAAFRWEYKSLMDHGGSSSPP